MWPANESQGGALAASDALLVWNINAREARGYLPAGVFVIVLIILGLPGNCLVIYVYNYHFKATTATFFIKVLAVIDAICCGFGMTFEIVDMFFPYLNGEEISCKLFRTLEQIVEFISGEVLFLIAWDRYLHICKPFKIWPMRKAKRLVLLVAVIGILFSAPTVLTMGRARTVINGTAVYACTTNPEFSDSIIFFVYYLLLNSITGFSFIVMCGQYICIWTAIHKWRRARVIRTSSIFVLNTSRKPSKVDLMSANESPPFTTLASMHSNNMGDGAEHSGRAKNTATPLAPRLSDDARGVRRHLHVLRKRAAVKPVLTLFTVTSVYVVSFTPYFLLTMLESTATVMSPELGQGRRQVWELLYKSYFLSNTMNPFIYATFDKRFRKKCYDILFRSHHYERVCCRI